MSTPAGTHGASQLLSERLAIGDSPVIDSGTFRSIMSCFPTGVTVITTRNSDGSFKGFTSNAITSVSLTPPMLLVCVARTSETLPVLREARRFVVNFLSAGQEGISRRFAAKGDSKFDGLRAHTTSSGLPVLRDAAVAFAECETELEVEAGDHIVLIGKVTHGEAPPEPPEPLLFYQSRYPTLDQET